jgi:hypothetical protein
MMKTPYKYWVFFILNLQIFQVHADEYRGMIGTYPIHLSTFDNDGYAVYIYDTQGVPIVLSSDGKTEEGIVLYEDLDWKPLKKPARAKLTFSQKLGQSDLLTGIWENLNSYQQLPIHLNRYDEPAGALQSAVFKKAYIRKSCSEDKVVRLFSKQSNALIQTIQTEGVCLSDEVEVDDYNFDGYEDFSVFNEGFAGPNTNRNYYLFNPKTQQYEYSDELTDVTLSFDSKTKTVTSTNQCCAGSQVLVLRLQWVKQHLKPIAKQCYKWNDKYQELRRVANTACD